MLLSVIIPYYNADTWIGKALDSLLDQDLPQSEYEIIVVDDGSTEDEKILKDYVSRFPNIHYYRIDHAGLSPARNYGLSKASGQWLYLCDGDDDVQPQVLGKMIAVANDHGLQMLQARRIKCGETETFPNPRRNFDSLSEPMSGFAYLGAHPGPFSWGVWSYLVRRDVIVDNNLSFESVFYFEDALFMLRLLEVVDRVSFMDVDLYFYRQHVSSILHSKRRKDGPECNRVWFMFLDRLCALMERPMMPESTLARLQYLRDKAVYPLLLHTFNYCPVKDTRRSISRLEALGAYPIKPVMIKKFPKYARIMNHKHLWVFLCWCSHLVPERFRA